jgi:hypothetical protein
VEVDARRGQQRVVRWLLLRMLGESRRVLERTGQVCRYRQVGQLSTICLQILEGPHSS